MVHHWEEDALDGPGYGPLCQEGVGIVANHKKENVWFTSANQTMNELYGVLTRGHS